MRWIGGGGNETTIQTKDVSGQLFNRYCKIYYEKDKYGASG